MAKKAIKNAYLDFVADKTTNPLTIFDGTVLTMTDDSKIWKTLKSRQGAKIVSSETNTHIKNKTIKHDTEDKFFNDNKLLLAKTMADTYKHAIVATRPTKNGQKEVQTAIFANDILNLVSTFVDISDQLIYARMDDKVYTLDYSLVLNGEKIPTNRINVSASREHSINTINALVSDTISEQSAIATDDERELPELY